MTEHAENAIVAITHEVIRDDKIKQDYSLEEMKQIAGQNGVDEIYIIDNQGPDHP